MASTQQQIANGKDAKSKANSESDDNEDSGDDANGDSEGRFVPVSDDDEDCKMQPVYKLHDGTWWESHHISQRSSYACISLVPFDTPHDGLCTTNKT